MRSAMNLFSGFAEGIILLKFSKIRAEKPTNGFRKIKM